MRLTPELKELLEMTRNAPPPEGSVTQGRITIHYQDYPLPGSIEPLRSQIIVIDPKPRSTFEDIS